jgi:hypothetical protein
MIDKREKSRQQWEDEIRARQQNVTPADYPEGMHYARFDGIPRIVSQWRFWLGIVVMAVGISIFRSGISVAAVVAGIVAGLCLAVTAMRWNNK